jgi:hypothetical protein
MFYHQRSLNPWLAIPLPQLLLVEPVARTLSASPQALALVLALALALSGQSTPGQSIRSASVCLGDFLGKMAKCQLMCFMSVTIFCRLGKNRNWKPWKIPQIETAEL